MLFVWKMKRRINSVLYIFIKSWMLRGCGNLYVVVVLPSMVINNCYFTSTLIRCVTFHTFSYKRAATLSALFTFSWHVDMQCINLPAIVEKTSRQITTLSGINKKKGGQGSGKGNMSRMTTSYLSCISHSFTVKPGIILQVLVLEFSNGTHLFCVY